MTKKQRPVTAENRTPCLVLFLFSFVCGAILGQVYADGISESMVLEVRKYLLRFLESDFRSKVTADTGLSLLWCYFRYPLISFLFGYSAVGVLVLPALLIAFSFFLSFSVCCFFSALGSPGLLFAAAAIGFRCLTTLTCLLLISMNSFRNAVALAGIAFGRGRRAVIHQFDHERSLKFAGKIFLVLFFCVCIDLFCSPWILSCAIRFSSV